MGADLYMEERNFRPRPNKGEWHGDELFILTDRFYTGYELLWRGPVTPDNASLIKVMLPGGIPKKPKVTKVDDDTFSRDDLLDGILNRCEDIEAVGEQAAEIAVDTTLDYVVQWLNGRGSKEAAETLEEIGGHE